MFSYLETGRFEESLATVLTEVSPQVAVLFPVEAGRVPVVELPAALLTLECLPQAVGGEVLPQVGPGGECFLTELTRPGPALVVDSLYVDFSIVTSPE